MKQAIISAPQPEAVEAGLDVLAAGGNVVDAAVAALFTLTVDLRPVAGGTQVSWHQAFDDRATAQAVRAICEPANEQNLDRLTRVLSAEAA